jgi:hypothetical protein
MVHEERSFAVQGARAQEQKEAAADFPRKQGINRHGLILASVRRTMMDRLSDMTLVGLIITALLFLGAMILFRQIVTLNPVKPFSVYLVFFSTVFGLGFGIMTGWLVTGDQLKILRVKGECKLGDSKAFVFAMIGDLLVFLVVSALILNAGRPAFAVGEIYFVISAVFTLFVARMVLIARFERHTQKNVMMDFWSSRLYLYPSDRQNTRAIISPDSSQKH